MHSKALRGYFIFAIKFILLFLLLNYGIKFMYGLTIKDGFYSPFIEQYFNIVKWIRSALIASVAGLLQLFAVETVKIDEFTLRAVNGSGIRMVYECLAIAINCLWISYTLTYPANLKSKLKWLFMGILSIWLLNTIRISLVLIANNKNLQFPLGIDHHTWFNLVAYLLLIILIYFFQKKHPLFPKTA
jgi:exosortase/archaeosortase family protein